MEAERLSVTGVRMNLSSPPRLATASPHSEEGMNSRILSVGVLSLGVALTAGAQETKSARWSGNFQPVQIRSSSVGMRIQSRIYGTAELAPVEGNPSRSRARLRFSVQTDGTSFTVQWALVSGRCGSGAIPVAPLENFPVIEVGSNGRAQLDDELALQLPSSGDYHVNVYLGGQNLDQVFTCAIITTPS